MTPERWQQVKTALDDALSLGQTERAALLARLGATDPGLRDEVESLLAAEADADDRFLNVTPHAALGLEPLQRTMIGRRCGPYQLIEEIGVGGMGEVYKARRVDDEYQQQVAIKLVHGGPGSSFIGSRLRAERQILASLEHPNIARLLDGGTTEEGVPYLVMELIDGQPITEYCDRHGLDVSARLKLFLHVCSAVQFAHQRMVIHRDLKPGNVLVTHEGVPKLLDFGISKILEPGATTGGRADLTIATLGILTPQYASPEQLLGQSVTAASDVYSLGVLLYELLTGSRPHDVPDHALHEQRVAMLAVEPKRPSLVAPKEIQRQLRGDLDKIALMALRREPERRYGTAEQLAEDVRRHLGHRPVSARTPTMGYLLSSFFARHRLGVSLTAVIVIGLCVGVGAVLRESRIAEAHRAEAEKRFNDVRKLASTLIFDIDTSIRDVPGTAPSRRILIDTALQYLGSLSKDTEGNPELELETAAAYVRLGDIQGSLWGSQDDYSGSLASYRKALTLLQSAERFPTTRARARNELRTMHYRLSDVLWVTGDVRGALSYAELAVADSRAQLRGDPNDGQNRFYASLFAMDYGYKLFRIRGDYVGALASMRESIADLEPLMRARATAPVRRLLAVAYSKTSELLLHEKQFAEALDMNMKSMRIMETLLASSPNDADYRVNYAAAQHYAAAALMNLGRLEEARKLELAAQEVVSRLHAAEPAVSEFEGFIGMAHTALAEIAERQGHPEAAVPLLRDAIEELGNALTAGTKHPYIRYWKAKAESHMGKALEMLASNETQPIAQRARSRAEARDWYQRALDSFAQVRPIWAEAGEDAERLAGRIAGRQGASGSEPPGE
jgi:non-specific serine/threonine protein kinase/serine/threonine-protein kinase